MTTVTRKMPQTSTYDSQPDAEADAYGNRVAAGESAACYWMASTSFEAIPV
jgi:hypothetical protein